MSEAYPQRRLELDLYEADIGSIYEHYGDIFYQYHRQFTKKTAAYLEKGIKISSVQDDDLSMAFRELTYSGCSSGMG